MLLDVAAWRIVFAVAAKIGHRDWCCVRANPWASERE
jgi:hypothetical protein